MPSFKKAIFLVQLYFTVGLSMPGYGNDKINTGSPPVWVDKIDINKDSGPDLKEITDGYTYILTDYQTNINEKINFYHYGRKIYTEAGLTNGSEISINYDPTYEKLTFHEIKILRGDQTLNRLDPAKFKIIQRESGKENHIFDGSLTAFLILEDTRAGDIIEYSFSIAGKNPIYHDKFFTYYYLQGSDPISKLNVKIICPKDKKLNFLGENTEVKPDVENSGQQIIYKLNLENIPGKLMDSEAPSWFDPYPIIWVSEYNSWKEIKEWALDLYKIPEVKSGGLKDKIEQIKKQFEKSEERLREALKFVQNEIRYTGIEAGIGAYKPTLPSEVFEMRFGDCKGKSLLLCCMLKEMGIKAYPALLNTSYKGEIKKWLPIPTAFNHCVVFAELENERFWYDPTYSHQGGNYDKIYFPNYSCALPVKAEGEDLMDIPEPKNSKSVITESFNLSDIGSTSKLTVTSNYYGVEADNQRYYFSHKILSQTEKEYLNFYAKTYPSIKVEKPLSSQDNERENIFTTVENYEIENFWTLPDTSNPDYVEGYTYAQIIRDKIPTLAKTIRTMPVALEYPLNHVNILELNLPQGWNVANEEKIITGPGINYKRTVENGGSRLTITYSYNTTSDHVDAPQIKEMVKKQSDITNDLGFTFNYTNPPSGFQFNYMMMLYALIMLGICIFISYKLYYYDPVPPVPAKIAEPIGGWLALLCLGLLFSPFTITYQLFQSDLFNLNIWKPISNSGLPSYNLFYCILILAEIFFNIVLICFSVLLINLFFKQRSSTPRLIAVFYLINIVGLVLDTLISKHLNLSTELDDQAAFRDISFTIVKAAIWVSYLFLSERSRKTFVIRLEKPDDYDTFVPKENDPPIELKTGS
jgi:transglutaminase-like putative cysteine protease